MVLSIKPRIRTIFIVPTLSSRQNRTLLYSQQHQPASTQKLYGCNHCDILDLNGRLKQLAKNGRTDDARKLFDTMPQRDEISWTNMISAYANTSRTSEALSLFTEMWAMPGLRPDEFVLNVALKACGTSLNYSFGETLHACSIKSGLINSIFVGSCLLDMYMKMGIFEQGCRVFEFMPTRNVVTWTAIITRLVHAGYCSEGLAYFSEMWRSKLDCDEFLYAIALKACADSYSLNQGKVIHAQTLKNGFDESSFVPNSLASMYTKCGELAHGFRLFATIKDPDVVSWTAIITAYLQAGREEEAIGAFVRMGQSEVSPNEYTFAAVISGCAELARLDWGEQFHARVLRLGLLDYVSVSNSIVTMYSKCGRLTLAAAAFREMERKSIVSWTAIISGYCQGGFGEEAFEFFSQMRRDGPEPNEFSLSSLLSVCGSTSALDQGTQLHCHVISVGLERKSLIQSSLITMYSKCGSVREASRVFESVEQGDVVTWTAMIGGFAEHGLSREAVDLFERMTRSGSKPDAVTFVGVLTACSHSGLVGKGFQYFESMVNDFEIIPSREHYGCLVDLLCRAGRLSEAERLIKSVPHQQDEVVWSSLLRACVARGDVDRSQRAAKEILRLNPSCSGTHVTLANMYLADGKWKEASELRKTLRSKGVVKEPGWSWIGVAGRVTGFVSGDRSHQEWDRICSVLNLLVSEPKPVCVDKELNSPLFDFICLD